MTDPLSKFGDHATPPRASAFDWLALALISSFVIAWLGLASHAMWAAVSMFADGNLLGSVLMVACAVVMVWVLGLEFWAAKDREDATE